MATCNTETGQCICKPGVTALRCNECRDGTFGLHEENLFGCSDCGCNVGGSVDNTCDKLTGQCRCRPRVTGQQCDEPLQLHYFPTLYQLQYEAEDGHTPQNTAVRQGYHHLLLFIFSVASCMLWPIIIIIILIHFYCNSGKITIWNIILRGKC